jgi:hypothetical protein
MTFDSAPTLHFFVFIGIGVGWFAPHPHPSSSYFDNSFPFHKMDMLSIIIFQENHSL